MIEIGRMLRASITGCIFGTWVNQVAVPYLGGIVKITLNESTAIYGMIHDIQVADDGLVQQLLSAQNVRPEIIADNRQNRNVPVEISVLFLGYEEKQQISHLLPPRPPLSLDEVHQSTPTELDRFTSHGFGYLRHILRDPLLPAGEILAVHLKDMTRIKDSAWLGAATQELITLLRDDYPRLMSLMSALADAGLDLRRTNKGS